MYILSMSGAVAKVLEQAKLLSESEKIQVVDKLLYDHGEDKDPSYDKSWEVELRRRKAEMDSGEVEGILWSDVKKEIQAKYNWS